MRFRTGSAEQGYMTYELHRPVPRRRDESVFVNIGLVHRENSVCVRAMDVLVEPICPRDTWDLYDSAQVKQKDVL